MSLARFISILLLLPLVAVAQLRKPYGKPSQWAVTAEVGGVSPVFSINAEWALLQSRKSFFIARAGVGHLFTGYSLLTLPHSLTWNRVLNGKVKGCPPRNPRNSLMAEVGLGGSYLAGAIDEVVYRWSPLLGLRGYYACNHRATGFWKVQLTPLVSGKLAPWGGVGIGLVID